MSRVQSVLFNRKSWNTDMARVWLKQNDFKRLKKVDITRNFLRYRILDPRQFRTFRIKKLPNVDIEFVLGFK